MASRRQQPDRAATVRLVAGQNLGDAQAVTETTFLNAVSVITLP